MTDLDDLRAELDEFAQPEKKKNYSAREERIIAGFEEIQRFVEQQGRAPQHGEDKDIFERLYAVRLERLRALEECRELLIPRDHQGLLSGAYSSDAELVEVMDDDALLAELAGAAGSADITELRHVRTSAEKRAAEEIATRSPCKDFHNFKPLFEEIQKDIELGTRKTIPFGRDGSVEVGNFFILSGQKVYVAEVGEEFIGSDGRTEYRLRVIFDNGVESNQLMRSLQKRLWEDKTSRRITVPDLGPLFSDSLEEGDSESGTIYVLRSLSDNPYIAEHRDVIHKIGVTGGKVETRIANAEYDSTYLLAKVEVVATYKLAGINRTRLESLFHRLFEPARLSITINDRFGHPVKPEEWFLVPLFVIDEAVARIKDGSITGYIYDPKAAELVKT